MVTNAVPFMTMTERRGDKQRMLTGRLGDSVVIGLRERVDGAAPRWRFMIVDVSRHKGGARPSKEARQAEFDEMMIAVRNARHC